MTGPAPVSFRRFPATTLPWVVAACAVVVYSLTLNPWVSFGSVQEVARLSGWLWDPDLTNPLYFLLTLPLRALPQTWIPAALNLFNALCAAATLGLLARTVAILPHNRTHEQRVRGGADGQPLSFRSAWLPPTLAAAVCGLQLTFWENATAGTPEMLNLLLLAYVIRCLLEFRLDGRSGWLWQTAFLWGAGMANDYAIVGFFPLYIVALIWLKRIRFFEGRFLLRMSLFGVAGILLYLLLPLLQSRNADLPVGFWPALKYALGAQKAILLSFPKTVLLLGLTSLVPILLISIRWPQHFGDLSPQGARFATFMFHIVHGVFLLVCIWVAFDPPFSPRNVSQNFRYPTPFLTFYYLAAIAIGYFADYFLLIFGRPAESPTYTYGHSRPSLLRNVIVVGVWAVSLAAMVGLPFRNLPQIRLTNSSMLRDYASLIADEIPSGNTVVLSDDPAREFILQSILTQRGDRPDVLLLNTASLVWPQYHRIMAEKHPDRWPVPPPTNTQAQVPEGSLVNLMIRFSRSNQICYAHPSFGYYFEYFQARPAGILNLLEPYPKGDLLPQPLTRTAVASNDRFWDESAARLLETVKVGLKLGQPTAAADARNPIIEKLHLEDEENPTARILGQWLSRSLNSYGVDLQRSGFLEQAATRFEQAVRFNPENVAAAVNLKFNADLQANRPSSVYITQSVEDQFGRYRGWNQVINANGLFDEPQFTMALAELFLKGRLLHQALCEFHRVCQLLPDSVTPRMWYARLASKLGDPDAALETVDALRDQPQRFTLTSTNRVELTFVEAAAYLAKRKPDRAAEVVETAISQNSANSNLINAAVQFYIKAKLFTNSLSLIDRQLTIRPEDVDLLVNKGFVLLRMKDDAAAVDVLSRALELQSNSAPARLNRAIANLQLGRLDAAQTDYESLLLQFPKAYPIYYGLGEIAFRRGETNQAIYNFQLYLSNAPPRTAEARAVRHRLEGLSGEAGH